VRAEQIGRHCLPKYADLFGIGHIVLDKEIAVFRLPVIDREEVRGGPDDGRVPPAIPGRRARGIEIG
jgi:hypothetical protein